MVPHGHRRTSSRTMTFADSFAVLAIAGDGTGHRLPAPGRLRLRPRSRTRPTPAGVVAGTTWHWPRGAQAGDAAHRHPKLPGRRLRPRLRHVEHDLGEHRRGLRPRRGRLRRAHRAPGRRRLRQVRAAADGRHPRLRDRHVRPSALHQAARNAEHNAALFFYSIEASVDVDGQAPKAMACSLGGVWGAVPSKTQHEQHTAGRQPRRRSATRTAYSHYMSVLHQVLRDQARDHGARRLHRLERALPLRSVKSARHDWYTARLRTAEPPPSPRHTQNLVASS